MLKLANLVFNFDINKTDLSKKFSRKFIMIIKNVSEIILKLYKNGLIESFGGKIRF